MAATVIVVFSLYVTAGDGKFVITRCCDDGKLRGLRGIAIAMMVVVVFS